MVMNVMMTVLEVFHHIIAIQIVGMKESKGDVREYECSLMDVTLEVIVLWMMREYVMRWQANISDYVAAIPIYELCTGA